MEHENASILLIGMNDEKTGLLYDILRCTDYKISSLFSIEQIRSSSELIRADCLIVDYAAWSDALSDVENSGLIGKSNILPVIVTGDKCYEEKSFSTGVSDFIAFPFCSAEVVARVNNQIRISRLNKKIIDEFEEETSELKKANLILNHSVEEYIKILQDLQENETLFLKIALNIPNSYLAIIEKDLTISFAAGQEFKKII